MRKQAVQREEYYQSRVATQTPVTTRQQVLIDWQNRIKEERMAKAQVRKNVRAIDRETWDKAFYQTLLHYDEPAVFLETVNYKLGNILETISTTNKNLSEKELVFLGLIILNISTAEIATLMEYSMNSLPTIKSRVSKKLGLKSANDLYQYLYDSLI